MCVCVSNENSNMKSHNKSVRLRRNIFSRYVGLPQTSHCLSLHGYCWRVEKKHKYKCYRRFVCFFIVGISFRLRFCSFFSLDPRCLVFFLCVASMTIISSQIPIKTKGKKSCNSSSYKVYKAHAVRKTLSCSLSLHTEYSGGIVVCSWR